jgi:hypothetical protein
MLARVERMRTLHRLVPLLSGTVLAACSPSDNPPGSPPEELAVATSFEVTATLSFLDEPRYDVTFPEGVSFVLRLDGALGQPVTALLANYQGTADGVLVRTDAGLSLREPTDLPYEFGDYDPFGAPGITWDALLLVLEDRDGDGNADVVTGTGSGILHYALGDIGVESAFMAEIYGDRDVTPPTLDIAGNSDGLHVLEGLRVVASEPLQPGSTARLWLGDTPIELVAFPASGKYVRSFSSSAVLPFDADLRVEIEPVPQDLAGLAAESGELTARTMAGPALFAEDGFEADPVALVGQADVVAGVGTLPAIAGARSLLVEPGDALTMRIPLTGGETQLRFRARMLIEGTSYGCPTHEMRVGAQGIAGLTRINVGLGEDPLETTGDAYWMTAGPIGEVQVPIPAGAAGEVLFDIYDTPPVAPPCPAVAYLIDDLRAE